MRSATPMTGHQFLRFRKQYERKQKEECKPHRGFYPMGFANYIKLIVKHKKMYESKNPQLALPAPDRLGDDDGGSGDE